jgi:hypothetical protein
MAFKWHTTIRFSCKTTQTQAGIEPLHIRFACNTTQTQAGIQNFAFEFAEFGVAERFPYRSEARSLGIKA